jgi:DNA ligase-1
MTILDALSWMRSKSKQDRPEIEKAYNVRPDLGFIAHLVKTDFNRLTKVEPVVGVPILMAKAERVANPEEIITKIGSCAIEPKYDGFRLQFHYQPGEVKIYSRGIEEVSEMFPDLIKVLVRELTIKNGIFEGEAIGYDPKTHQYLPFQETVQRKRKYQVLEKSREIPLLVFVFDLLFLNNQSLLNKNYNERRQLLKSVFSKSDSQVFSLAQEKVVNTSAEIQAEFRRQVQEGREGIMAKKLDGKYQAGARNWNWIKFKHSYDRQLIDTLDCVVMGFDFGQGKRTGFGIGAFLVGIYDAKKQQYTTLAKIGTGLTDEEWKKMAILCNQNKLSNQPSDYLVNKQLVVDVWVEPKIIVEIRADELTESPQHTTRQNKEGVGLALRFPRLERFREDKSLSDLTTVEEVVKLFQTQKK